MARFVIPRGHSNGGLFTVLALSFVGMLILFGWQTWLFVDWLFPDDQLIMKCLTLFSFDIMAFIWTVTRQFYHFAHSQSKTAVQWGKWVTFACSMLASIVYMILRFVVRFSGTVSPGLVMLSEAVAIVVLIVNILLVMKFLSAEISTRYPNEDEYIFADQARTPVQLARTVHVNQLENNENQVDLEDNQLENNENQVEIPYTHNGPAEKSWGGPRKGSGRKNRND